MSYLYHIGRYFLLVVKVFERPEKPSVYYNLILAEMMKLGLGSLGIISIISAFMGAVITLQTASQVESAWIPEYTVGYTTRMSVVLEFAPTIIALILAGKVGSNIASELGTMRVTEQIDALEIMGINSAGYLILPKIAASLSDFPILDHHQHVPRNIRWLRRGCDHGNHSTRSNTCTGLRMTSGLFT